MAQLGKEVKGGTRERKVASESAEDDERALQDRLQRAAEDDARRKVSQQARTELKSRLEAEMQRAKISRMRVQNHWLKIMRLSKVESLRRDVEVLSQSHERDVDRKDAIIQMLDRDLEEAEEQYQTSLRAHLRNLDALVDLQDARLLRLENEFEADLARLEDEFTVERESIVRQHAAERAELSELLRVMESRERDEEAEAKHQHEQTKEELKRKSLEEIQLLRMQLESNIEELERHFESAHLNYLQNTDQRTQDLKYLTRTDAEDTKQIRNNIHRIERLERTRSQWIAKINQSKRESEERNRALRSEKDVIVSHYQQLKEHMDHFRAQQTRKLSGLSQMARQTKDRLDQELGMAERILKLSELARKLETEREKVMPFYESSLRPEEETQAQSKADHEAAADVADAVKGVHDGAADSAASASAAAGPGAASSAAAAAAATPSLLQEPGEHQTFAMSVGGKRVGAWEYLDKFWKRYNKVTMEKLAIERERERLQQENGELKQILKQYLDGISITEEAIAGPNPLLVVNGRTNLTAPPVRHVARPTVVEAAHMVATRRAAM